MRDGFSLRCVCRGRTLQRPFVPLGRVSASVVTRSRLSSRRWSRRTRRAGRLDGGTRVLRKAMLRHPPPAQGEGTRRATARNGCPVRGQGGARGERLRAPAPPMGVAYPGMPCRPSSGCQPSPTSSALRAGESRGAADGRSRCSRMRRTTGGSVRKASTTIAAPQPGQTRVSTSSTLFSSAAHDMRCGRDGAAVAPGPVLAVGLGTTGAVATGTTIRAGGLGSRGRSRLGFANTP